MLAEDLLLLLTDDATGKLLLPAEQVDIALGGANLLELTLLERVSLDEGKHVVVFDPSSTGDPILDGALGVIGARQGRKPKAVVEPLGENLRTTLYIRLVAEGVLRAEERKVLGILPVHRWPAARAEHEERMRAQLTQVLVQGTTPDSRTAALVSLLHALNSEHRIVDPKEHGLTRKELAARAEEVSPGDWASEAVREAIEAVMAAVIFGDQVLSEIRCAESDRSAEATWWRSSVLGIRTEAEPVKVKHNQRGGTHEHGASRRRAAKGEDPHSGEGERPRSCHGDGPPASGVSECITGHESPAAPRWPGHAADCERRARCRPGSQAAIHLRASG